MNILALDTATEMCSAAVLSAGKLFTREAELDRGHAEEILRMIDAVLAEAGLTHDKLDAVAFGRGPGAFTGVRLAASVAQGLSFAWSLPVVPISDLAAVAQRALDLDTSIDRVLVCNDARMKEVYWGCFERREGLASLVGEERVGAPETVQLPAHWTDRVGGAGRGFRAFPELEARLGARLASVQPELLPRAAEVARLAVPELAAGRTVPAEQALPVYLRDEVARPSS